MSLLSGEFNPAATYGEAVNVGQPSTVHFNPAPYQGLSPIDSHQFGVPASPTQTQIMSVGGVVVYTESYPDHIPHKP